MTEPVTMIERVAKEMFRLRRRAQGASYFGGQAEIDTDWNVVRSLYVADAKAIIAALREPTDMMGNGLSTMPRQPYKPGSHSASDIWRAMIDCALEEKAGG